MVCPMLGLGDVSPEVQPSGLSFDRLPEVIWHMQSYLLRAQRQTGRIKTTEHSLAMFGSYVSMGS
jgi:hypothetical protein